MSGHAALSLLLGLLPPHFSCTHLAPIAAAAYASMSLVSSMILLVGFPAPCPARTSTRVSSGLRCGASGEPARVGGRRGVSGVTSLRASQLPGQSKLGSAPFVSIAHSPPHPPASTCCSVATSLRLCSGTTRSSWSPVVIRKAGYCRLPLLVSPPPAGGVTLCSGL